MALPRDLYGSLRALAFATQESVQDHVVRAVRGYLAEEGHRAAVHGLAERARTGHRGAFDLLGEP